MNAKIPVVSTKARRAARRDLLSTISSISSREGLSAGACGTRSRRRKSSHAIALPLGERLGGGVTEDCLLHHCITPSPSLSPKGERSMRGRDTGAEGVLRLSSGKIGEIEDFSVGNGLQDIGHRRVVSSAYVAFVLAHRLDEKSLPLARDPRDGIAARQVRVVANVAAILAYQGWPTCHAVVIGRCGRRPRRRQSGGRVGKCA